MTLAVIPGNHVDQGSLRKELTKAGINFVTLPEHQHLFGHYSIVGYIGSWVNPTEFEGLARDRGVDRDDLLKVFRFCFYRKVDCWVMWGKIPMVAFYRIMQFPFIARSIRPCGQEWKGKIDPSWLTAYDGPYYEFSSRGYKGQAISFLTVHSFEALEHIAGVLGNFRKLRETPLKFKVSRLI